MALASNITRMGIVSDTHGVLSQGVYDVLAGIANAGCVKERVWVDVSDAEGIELPEEKPCDVIVHAGDIGRQSVIDELETLAALYAVRGNCDAQDYFTKRGWTRDFESFTYAGVTAAVLHTPQDLRNALFGGITCDPYIVPMPRLCIHGHTHVPRIEVAGGAVTVCPGSPARPRGGSGPSVAVAYLSAGRILAVDVVAVGCLA